MRFLKIVFFVLCIGGISNDAYASLLRYQDDIDAFYLERDGEPLWIESSALNDTGLELIKFFEGAWQNGLDPRRYHVNSIHEIAPNNGGGSIDKSRAMELEVLLTDAYIQYIRDMSGMRVNARDLGLRKEDWLQPVSSQDALSYLPLYEDNILEFLRAQEPQGQTYKRLKEELSLLVEEFNKEQEQELERETIKFSGVIRPGAAHRDIPLLREIFGSELPDSLNANVYDSTLTQVVMDFQQSKGLRPDGLIGRQTLHALNHGTEDKIKQITVNMERLRWVADEKPERFIIVNIPSATLWAVEGGNVRYEMPVIVGRPKRPTNVFVSNIHGVRLNPTWTVPKTIKREDILPALIEDPEHLLHKGIELYDGYGRDAPTLDPMAIDWENVTEEELRTLRFVQKPGARNPLGRVRVLMPNRYDIYLHDTNDKHYFARVNRAKSSGCVRMKDPEDIAGFILEARSGWQESQMEKILSKGKIRDLYTQEKMPVYILYYTTWVGDNDQIVYGIDIYNRDKKLAQAIDKLDEFPALGDNNLKLVQLVD